MRVQLSWQSTCLPNRRSQVQALLPAPKFQQMRVQFSGRISAFQAQDEGSIPSTRTSFKRPQFSWQNVCLPSRRSWVRIPQVAPGFIRQQLNWQSRGLQSSRLRVQFLPGVPDFYACVVQWQNQCLPSTRRGFDSLHPHQGLSEFSSVGRTPVCQTGGHGFESRNSLQNMHRWQNG